LHERGAGGAWTWSKEGIRLEDYVAWRRRQRGHQSAIVSRAGTLRVTVRSHLASHSAPDSCGATKPNRDPFGTSTKEELPMATILLLCLWAITPLAVFGGVLLIIASDDF
jgi:hypothetical protein